MAALLLALANAPKPLSSPSDGRRAASEPPPSPPARPSPRFRCSRPPGSRASIRGRGSPIRPPRSSCSPCSASARRERAPGRGKLLAWWRAGRSLPHDLARDRDRRLRRPLRISVRSDLPWNTNPWSYAGPIPIRPRPEALVRVWIHRVLEDFAPPGEPPGSGRSPPPPVPPPRPRRATDRRASRPAGSARLDLRAGLPAPSSTQVSSTSSPSIPCRRSTRAISIDGVLRAGLGQSGASCIPTE